MAGNVSMDDSYDDFPRIEEAFGWRLDETRTPRGPDSVWELFAGLDPRPGDVVVDVGCGEGDDAVELVRRFAVSVHGVDPVERHIALGRKAARTAGMNDKVCFTVGTAEALPLPDGDADLVWSKEALMYADLDAALSEMRRVLRAGGRGFIYQVCTGPLMADSEASEFWQRSAAANSVRPHDIERAIASAGLVLIDRTDFASEWGEYAQEQAGAGGRRLVHTARLLRSPDRYIDEFGQAAYNIMLADCLWHVYRMIGKLHGAAFRFLAPDKMTQSQTRTSPA